MDKFHEMPLQEWQVRFRDGEFSAPDLRTQTRAGWHNWFCWDESLSRRLQPLGRFLLKLKSGGRVDLVESYVLFANRSPLVSRTYDQIKVCSRATGDVLYTVDFCAPYEGTRWTLYDCTPVMPTVVAKGKQKEVLDYLNTREEVLSC